MCDVEICWHAGEKSFDGVINQDLLPERDMEHRKVYEILVGKEIFGRFR
jgi:hypothetical protein